MARKPLRMAQVRRTSPQKPRARPRHLEEALQAQCVQWFRLQYPGKYILAIPNGGKRNLFEAVRLKKTGTLAGVADLFVAEPSFPHCGVWIELKVGKNKPTLEQRTFLTDMQARDFEVSVVRSLEEFQACIRTYFNA